MIHVIKNWLLSCKSYCVVIVITSVIISSIEATIPYLTARFIDDVLIPRNGQAVYGYSTVLVLLIGIFIVAKYVLEISFTKMIKVNWTKIAKILKVVATVITSVLGTLAVQSCMPAWWYNL